MTYLKSDKWLVGWFVRITNDTFNTFCVIYLRASFSTAN